jgi:acyl carrier protein
MGPPVESRRPQSQFVARGACALSPDTDLERGPLSRQEVLDLIRDRLADILEIDPDGIAEGASFSDDLDADSLALIELVEALEEELGSRNAGFRIDDEDLEDLKTVRDAVDYVVARTGGTSSS